MIGIDLTIGPKLASHPWQNAQQYHYFLAQGNGASILAGPQAEPTADPNGLIWWPYEWVPIDDLPHRNLSPPEIAEVSRQACDA